KPTPLADDDVMVRRRPRRRLTFDPHRERRTTSQRAQLALQRDGRTEVAKRPVRRNDRRVVLYDDRERLESDALLEIVDNEPALLDRIRTLARSRRGVDRERGEQGDYRHHADRCSGWEIAR